MVVGKGTGNKTVYIRNTRVDFPVYREEDMTITYNEEWFPDKFCKYVTIYIVGRENDGTMLQFGLYQQADQITTPYIVKTVTVLFSGAGTL